MGGVPVALSRDQVRSILSLYHLDGPDDFGGVSPGKAAYWVQACGRKFFLRVSQRRPIDDMIFEKEVLAHLQRHDLPVPSLVRNVAQGSFTPWSARGRYVSLFEYLPGRVPGVFELRNAHARSVGQLCARLHRALMSFARRRAYGQNLASAQALLTRLDHALDTRRLPRRYAPALEELRRTLRAQGRLDHRALATGTVHGGLDLSCVRFSGSRPSGVVDFEQAAHHRLTWDLASAVSAWCWVPSPAQHDGPAGSFDAGRVRSMLRAYHRIRPLGSAEQAALPSELKLVAAHEALSRLACHELARGRSKRPFLDYRHYTARLAALDNGAGEDLVRGAFS